MGRVPDRYSLKAHRVVGADVRVTSEAAHGSGMDITLWFPITGGIVGWLLGAALCLAADGIGDPAMITPEDRDLLALAMATGVAVDPDETHAPCTPRRFRTGSVGGSCGRSPRRFHEAAARSCR